MEHDEEVEDQKEEQKETEPEKTLDQVDRKIRDRWLKSMTEDAAIEHGFKSDEDLRSLVLAHGHKWRERECFVKIDGEFVPLNQAAELLAARNPHLLRDDLRLERIEQSKRLDQLSPDQLLAMGYQAGFSKAENERRESEKDVPRLSPLTMNAMSSEQLLTAGYNMNEDRRKQ